MSQSQGGGDDSNSGIVPTLRINDTLTQTQNPAAQQQQQQQQQPPSMEETLNINATLLDTQQQERVAQDLRRYQQQQQQQQQPASGGIILPSTYGGGGASTRIDTLLESTYSGSLGMMAATGEDGAGGGGGDGGFMMTTMMGERAATPETNGEHDYMQSSTYGNADGSQAVLTGMSNYGVDSVAVTQQQQQQNDPVVLHRHTPQRTYALFDPNVAVVGGGGNSALRHGASTPARQQQRQFGAGSMSPARNNAQQGGGGGGGGGQPPRQPRKVAFFGDDGGDEDDDPFSARGGGGGGGGGGPRRGGGGGGGGGGGAGGGGGFGPDDDGGDDAARPGQNPPEEDVFIWGTDISIAAFRRETGAFFDSAVDAVGERIFYKLLRRMRANHDNSLTNMHLPVDFRVLQEQAPALFRKVVSHPAECLQLMASVAEDFWARTIGDATNVSISIAANNMPATTALRELGPEQIETLVAIRGMVVRTSKLIPEVRAALFRCWKCHATEQSVLDRGRIFEPARCQACGTPNSFEMVHNLCLFDDKQVVRVQEAPENLAEGETPVTVSAVVYGDMVDTVVPGDRVVITGIFRSAPTKLNPTTRIIRSVFRTHVDALHIEKSTRVGGNSALAAAAGAGQRALLLQQQQLQQQQDDEDNNEDGRQQQRQQVEGGGGDFTPSRAAAAMMEQGERYVDPTPARGAAGHGNNNPVGTPLGGPVNNNNMKGDLTDNTARLSLDHRTEALLESLGRLPDIETILVDSLAPAIFGHDEVKRGILCQLFGGSRKNFGRGAFRAELNVLLCGDPGVAKSQLLTRVHDISPRGVYTSGKGSSSVGLTAFVVRDADTGEFVLEPGALVLSDRGICCIDEFDKMGDSTRSVLHEVMEQQTLSVAKAGIISTLNARTSILAAANPKESQWNPAMNIVENLQIEPTLLSRFDLIFLLLDRQDEAMDRRLARHVLKMYADPSAFDDEADGANNNNNANPLQQLVDNEDPFAAAGLQAQQQRMRNQVQQIGQGPAGNNRGPTHPFLDDKRRLSVPLFALYVAYAREKYAPKLNPSAQQKVVDAYVAMRQARGTGKVVTATLRQLESMIRISESFAKMRLQRDVEGVNVEAAAQLIANALQEAATDPRTGLINMGMFTAPDLSRSSMEASMLRLEHIIKAQYTDAGKRSAPVGELRSKFNEHLTMGVRPHNQAQFAEVLAHMVGGGVVLSHTPTIVNFV